MLQMIQDYQWIVIAIATFLVGLDGIFGGFQKVGAVLRFLFRIAPASYYLEYENLDRRIGIDRMSRKSRGVLVVQLHTYLMNDNDFPIYAIPATMTSHLGGARAEELVESRRIVKVVRGVKVLVADGPIGVKIPPGGHAEGRVEWFIKYGRARDELDKMLTIKGSIGCDANGKQSMLTWLPDEDSDLPSGMKAMAMDVSDGVSPHRRARQPRPLD